jgi:hypothetical protein
MYNPDTGLLFHPRIIPALGQLRDSTWQELVNQVILAGDDSVEQLIFVLTMSRLNNCATCNPDSFRALNGCTACAILSIKRFRGSDQALVDIFRATRVEVEQFTGKEKISP